MNMVVWGITSVAISIVAFVVVTRAWIRFLDRRAKRYDQTLRGKP